MNGSATTYAVSIDVAVAVRASARRDRRCPARDPGGRRGRHPARADDRRHGDDAPAALAGAHVDDLVQSINGRAVESIADVTALVRSFDPGHTVVMGLRRGKKAVAVRVKLGAISG